MTVSNIVTTPDAAMALCRSVVVSRNAAAAGKRVSNECDTIYGSEFGAPIV